jgi:UDP-glucose 4-epimerase
MTATHWTVVGGAGFIGGHFVDRLLSNRTTAAVTVYDNFSSGREWHLASAVEDPRMRVIRSDVRDIDALAAAIRGSDAVIHLASNPDIARAVTEPSVDFHEGTLLTHCVVEACRLAGVGQLLYASGSGVYGDIGDVAAHEDMGPLRPVSTYGASKLAGEALICSYCQMFGFNARAFRFGNVVGPRQTHGVGFDFLRSLLRDPTRLRILGDGNQTKSYVHVTDIVDAVLMASIAGDRRYEVFNVATGDYISVTEIADIVVECCGFDRAAVVYEYTGGSRGWRGDVPVVRLSTDRIRATGWTPSRSAGEAMRDSILAMLPDARAGRL